MDILGILGDLGPLDAVHPAVIVQGIEHAAHHHLKGGGRGQPAAAQHVRCNGRVKTANLKPRPGHAVGHAADQSG